MEAVKARQAKLRKLRALAFYDEQRSKRMKKIKSKLYRKLRKKERQKLEGHAINDREAREKLRAVNAAYANYEVDSARWPKFAGMIARVREQPQVKAVLQKEAEALGFG